MKETAGASEEAISNKASNYNILTKDCIIEYKGTSLVKIIGYNKELGTMKYKKYLALSTKDSSIDLNSLDKIYEDTPNNLANYICNILQYSIEDLMVVLLNDVSTTTNINKEQQCRVIASDKIQNTEEILIKALQS